MRTWKQYTLITCAICFLAPLAWAKQHAFIWDSVNGLRDLGTLGGDNSYAFAINASGQVTGFSYLADNVTNHAFLWTAAGGMVDLGVPAGTNSSVGNAINASGKIAGQGYDGTTQSIFSWSGGTFTSLPSSASIYDAARGINDAGYITGNRAPTGTDLQAFLWNPARNFLSYLGVLPGGSTSSGNGVNKRLDVTGTSTYSILAASHAFLWTRSGGMQDIGAIPSDKVSNTYGASINDRDEVVGFGGIRVSFAFYWSPTTPLTLLQELSHGSAAEGGALQILNNGMIVGDSKTTGGAFHAVIWANHTSAPQDLGTLPGGTNSYGRGLNASGQVGFSDVN